MQHGILQSPRDKLTKFSTIQNELVEDIEMASSAQAMLGVAEQVRLNFTDPDATRQKSKDIGLQVKDAKMNVQAKFNHLIYSDYVQSGEFFGKMNGHSEEFYTKDKDGKFLHGIHYVMLTKPENILVAEKLLELSMKGLVERGRYDILGSEKYKKAVDSFIDRYPNSETRKNLYEASVMWFVNKTYRRIENQIDDPFLDSERINAIDMQMNGKNGESVSKNTYKQVFAIFSNLSKFQKTRKPIYLCKIHRSKIVTDKSGVLRLRTLNKHRLDSANSTDQQGRMLLLALDNVGSETAELILDYVQEYPALSRSITGKLPAGLHSFLVRNGANHLIYKTLKNWPTPPAASIPRQEPTEENIRTTYDYALRCILAGWSFPEGIEVLPQAMIDILRLHYTRQHPGWIR